MSTAVHLYEPCIEAQDQQNKQRCIPELKQQVPNADPYAPRLLPLVLNHAVVTREHTSA